MRIPELVFLIATPHPFAWWWALQLIPLAGVVGAIIGVAAYVFIPGVRQAVNEVTVAILKAALDAIWFVIKPLVDTVAELVTFVGQFLAAIAQLFAQDAPRAIFRIVLVAAYLWIFDLAKGIPVIRDILNLILTTAEQVTRFANDLFDQGQRALEALRSDLTGAIGNVFRAWPDLAAALRQDIMFTVDTLIGRLEGELVRARVEVLARVDLVGQLLQARVSVLGQTFAVVPDTVRRYLLQYERFHGAQAVQDTRELITASVVAGPPVEELELTVWRQLDVAVADMRAAYVGPEGDTAAAVSEAVGDMRTLLAGSLPPFEGLPAPGDLTPPSDELEPGIPVPPELIAPPA